VPWVSKASEHGRGCSLFGQLHYFLPLLRLAQRAAPSASACQLMREVGIATCNGDLPPHRRT